MSGTNHGSSHEELDLAAIERLLCEIEHVLEEVIGLLERIKEEQIRLAQLESFDLVLLSHAQSDRVQRGELAIKCVSQYALRGYA